MNLDTIWCDDSRTFPLSDRNVNSNYAIKKNHIIKEKFSEFRKRKMTKPNYEFDAKLVRNDEIK